MMHFPFVVVAELNDQHIDRYHRHIDSAESGWHRKWTESIWRRHQHPSNARLSGWQSPLDQKRRLIHFYDEYGLEGRSFVLRGTYLWLNLDLPADLIEEYRVAIAEGLVRGEWKAQGELGGVERWQRGDLTAQIAFCACHAEDAKRGRDRPSDYRNLDITIQTQGYRVPEGWRERPWRVFYDVGLRKTLARGKPRRIEPEEIEDYLPAQLELGCGPSIEAGIPHLSTLHRIYGVSRGDYGFVFRAQHDGFLELFSQPERKFVEMTNIYRACLLAQSTDFYDTALELSQRGLLVGPVITNNFDCQCASLGMNEISLRRYDWGPYYPTIDYDARAKSLLVVGVHADRRLVQMRARDRGLKVVFVDPEEYIGPEGDRIHYPVEAPQEDDLLVGLTAQEAFTRLRARLNK